MVTFMTVNIAYFPILINCFPMHCGTRHVHFMLTPPSTPKVQKCVAMGALNEGFIEKQLHVGVTMGSSPL